MPARTRPSITAAQNSPRAVRLVSAMARLYSDAKAIHHWRLALVLTLAMGTAGTGLAVPQVRPSLTAVGGLVLFVVALVVTGVEKRRRTLAVEVQEEFDTLVFQLPWNTVLVDRPPRLVIEDAAARYTAGRAEDWYPGTGRVQRPLDILICQASNLGWGASSHRRWAGLLGALLALIAVTIAAVTWSAELSVGECVLTLLLPALAPAKEVIEMLRGNLEVAAAKESVERRILGLWKAAMGGATVTVEECRAIQDRIVQLRQSTAYVPDWLDRRQRGQSEDAMRKSADALVREAMACKRIA